MHAVIIAVEAAQAAQFIYEHRNEVLSVIRSVQRLGTVALDTLDRVRAHLIGWFSSPSSGRQLTSYSKPKQKAIQNVVEELNKDKVLKEQLLDPHVPSGRILDTPKNRSRQFKSEVAYVPKEVQKTTYYQSPFSDVPDDKVKEAKVQIEERAKKYAEDKIAYKGMGRERLVTLDVGEKGAVTFTPGSKGSYKPATSFYYSQDPSVISAKMVREEDLARLSLHEIRESYWLRDVLHAADDMTLASMFPGEKPTPYFDGNSIPALNSATLNITDSFGNSTANWTFMAWAPTVGAMAGGSGYTDSQMTDAQFTASSTGNLNGFNSITQILTNNMSSLYTAPPPYTNNVFVWAGELSFSVEAPQATVAGTVYRALIPWRQYANGLTLKQIQILSLREGLVPGKKYSIRNCVQNRALVHRSGGNNNTTFGDWNNEFVAVVMIHNPSLSITGSAPLSYDIIQGVKINYSYIGLQDNPWTGSIGVNYDSLDRPKKLPSVTTELGSGTELDLNSGVHQKPGVKGTNTAAGNGNSNTNASQNEVVDSYRPLTVVEGQYLKQNLSQLLKPYTDYPDIVRESYLDLLSSAQEFYDRFDQYLKDISQVAVREKAEPSFRAPSVGKK